MGSGYLGIQGVWKQGDIPNVVLDVYAPCEIVGKMRLWEQIISLKESI